MRKRELRGTLVLSYGQTPEMARVIQRHAKRTGTARIPGRRWWVSYEGRGRYKIEL